MAKVTSNGIAVALDTATVVVGGDFIAVRQGEAWDSLDPVVTAHPWLFTLDRAHLKVRRTRPRVEQATANPGELR